MTPTPEVQERIRRYLLGQLTDGAREELEQDLLTNQELFEELLVVEDETVDDYLAGKLNPEERTSFEQYFMATPERHEKLGFGRAFDRYLSSQTATASVPGLKPTRTPWSWTQAFLSSPVRIAACAIVLVVIALGVWRVFFHESEVDKGLLALNAAYREQRPVEARISKLDYAPFAQTRGANQPERVDALARDRAELTLLDALNKNPTPAVHHALGKVYLAKKDFDKAIEQFDAALKADPKNAQLYSDLGAAWLEKGKIDLATAKNPARAWKNWAAAWRISIKRWGSKQTLLEALFNRALCRQDMKLQEQAGDDWREYLKKDPPGRGGEDNRLNPQKKKTENIKKQKTKTKNFMEAIKKQKNDEAAWGGDLR